MMNNSISGSIRQTHRQRGVTTTAATSTLARVMHIITRITRRRAQYRRLPDSRTRDPQMLAHRLHL